MDDERRDTVGTLPASNVSIKRTNTHDPTLDSRRTFSKGYQNSLERLLDQDIVEEAYKLADGCDLSDKKEYFAIGALILKYDGDVDRIPPSANLTPFEKNELDREQRSNFRGHRGWIYFTVFFNSIAAAIQGWDETGTNGANLLWPRQLGIPIDACGPQCCDAPSYCPTYSLLVGFVNSLPYISITLTAIWLNDPCNHVLGRRGTIILACAFSLLAPLGSAFCQTWPQLAVCRALLGIGMGLKESTVPIYSAEIAPAKIRGALVMSWQIWTAFGILIGSIWNIIGFAIFENPDFIWRIQLGSALVPAVILLMGVWFCPESPRWLIKKHRYKQAFASLEKFQNTPLQAAREFFYIKRHFDRDLSLSEGSSISRGFSRFGDLFRRYRVARATLAASVVMAVQQLSGINILAFYSSTIFASTSLGSQCVPTNPSPASTLHDPFDILCGTQYRGLDRFYVIEAPLKNCYEQALGLSLGFGVVNFFFSLPAIPVIDRWGRRTLLLVTLPFMALFLYIGAGAFAGKGNAVTVPIFLFLFAILYSPGLGPVPFTYSAEVFSIRYREVGMSWAVMINNLFGSVFSLTFPLIFSSLGHVSTLALFASFNVLAFILVFLFVPETNKYTLEEMDYIFDFTIADHMGFQRKDMLPWIKRRVRHPFPEKGTAEAKPRLYQP